VSIKISRPTHPYTELTEDFLLRQAAAELVMLEGLDSHSDADHAALSRVLWNWLAEYGAFDTPPELPALATLVKEFVSGATPSAAPAIERAKKILGESEAR